MLNSCPKLVGTPGTWLVFFANQEKNYEKENSKFKSFRLSSTTISQKNYETSKQNKISGKPDGSTLTDCYALRFDEKNEGNLKPNSLPRRDSCSTIPNNWRDFLPTFREFDNWPFRLHLRYPKSVLTFESNFSQIRNVYFYRQNHLTSRSPELCLIKTVKNHWKINNPMK